MIQSTISELPWQVVGTDLFQWLGSNYVLVVDYMSRFVEVAKLENSTSSMVIHHIKSFFSRHGIPREVRSDNGPCYSSAELKKIQRLGIYTYNIFIIHVQFEWTCRNLC